MIGLNLGCGRATFPTTTENKFTDHLRYALLSGCAEAFDISVNWINIDRVNGPNIHEVVNLFRLPWVRSNGKPFEDNSIDIIWQSHIVEHIPHAMQINPNAHLADGYLMKLAQTDGDMWFGWFYECWRILKPGGRMHVLAPYGFSIAGLGDPTHTRYILPSTLGYFAPNSEAPFDYDLPFRFKQIPADRDSNLPANGYFKIIGRSSELREEIDALKHLSLTLADPNLLNNVSRQIAALEKEFEQQMSTHVQQVEELYFVFEAVKP